MFPICGWTPIPFTTTTQAPETTTTVNILPDPECDQNSNGTLNNNLIKNGHITCDTSKNCYAKCNVGYIPENSANKHKIFSQIKCDENNRWSDLPFTKCIKFESFCNFTQELSEILKDPNAKLSMRVLENPPNRPAVVGRMRTEIKCRSENFYFDKIKRSCFRLRCECLYRNGKYFCRKWPQVLYHCFRQKFSSLMR